MKQTSEDFVKAETRNSNKESDTADATWPDGTLENVPVPASIVSGPGKMPHFGWALCQSAQKGLTNGDLRRFYYCLGVYKCTECDFVARPLMPDSRYKKHGCPPHPPSHTCVVHKTKPLMWNECTCRTNPLPMISRRQLVSFKESFLTHCHGCLGTWTQGEQKAIFRPV